MKKQKKQEIEGEINVINSFGVGMGAMVILLATYIYFGLRPTEIIYPFLLTMVAIIIRSIILKRRLK